MSTLEPVDDVWEYGAPVSSANPLRNSLQRLPWWLLLLMVAHVALAFLVGSIRILSTLHTLAVFMLGFVFLLRDKTPTRLIYLSAYLVGAEIFWRSTFSGLAHEFSKYAVALLFGLAMLRYHRLLRADKRPLLYFVLLVPAIFYMPSIQRDVIAFNLSGPFLMVLTTMLFSTVTLTREQLQRSIELFCAPLIGTASLAIIRMNMFAAAGQLRFGNDSNRWTSGGLGPNQVSVALGLGAFLALMYFILFDKPRSNRIIMLLIAIWFFSQAVFTFSRGGVYSAVAAIAVAAFYLMRDRRARMVLVVGGGLAVAALAFVIVPALDAFSGGVLLVRFQDTGTTGRNLIFQEDIQTFLRNPIFGVGLGESIYYHADVWRETVAHSELSRMLADHGLFGLASLLVLAWITAERVLSRRTTPVQKALVVSLTAWAVVTTMHVATRMAGPSFAFGLAAATFWWSDDPPPDEQVDAPPAAWSDAESPWEAQRFDQPWTTP